MTSIGENAFNGCSGLTSITIPNSVTCFDYGAFGNCSGLTSVTIPNSVTSIGKYAFRNCSGLTSVTIPNSVSIIDNCAFIGCSSLISITIGNGLKYLNSKAFCNCPNLTDVTCYAENVPNANRDVFENSYIEYTTLHVPAESIEAYKVAEPWSGFKNIKIIMPIYTLTYMIDGERYKSYQVEEGTTIYIEPNPVKEGYSFSGWSEIPETMPAHDVMVTGTFSINSYKLIYMIDDKVYKETMFEYGATIIPEPQPEGDYATFKWIELPEKMPAHDAVVYASYTSGIAELLMNRPQNVRIYSPSGKQFNALQRGVNILRMSDGRTMKIVVK